MSQSPRKSPPLKLPNFEPLPPDKWINRVINNLLRPIFYLFFTLITSIIVIPIYTIFENIVSQGRSSRRTPSGGNNDTAYTVNGQPVERESGSLQSFLKGYGASYGHNGAKHSSHHRRKA